MSSSPSRSAESERSNIVRRLATGMAAVVVVVIAASCADNTPVYLECDYVVRQCRMVCNYWCDSWGCYPTCWDQCWDECYRNLDAASGDALPTADVSTLPAPDAGSPSGGGSGALCSACVSNADCGPGAFCIFHGGPSTDASIADAGPPSNAGFCGSSCSSAADCPSGFACSLLGGSRQCLPTSGKCD